MGKLLGVERCPKCGSCNVLPKSEEVGESHYHWRELFFVECLNCSFKGPNVERFLSVVEMPQVSLSRVIREAKIDAIDKWNILERK